MCLENATLLTAERNISGVKKLTHCSLHVEEEGPVKWHHLGNSCKVGHRATGMKPRAGDALQMCLAHTDASGHAVLPGLWQQLPVERGWQQLWREACAGSVPELKSSGQLLGIEDQTGREQRVPEHPRLPSIPPQSRVTPAIVFTASQTPQTLSLSPLSSPSPGPTLGCYSAVSHK